MILYPAIDLLDGRCVRLRQGRFAEATVYGDDPEAVAATYARAGAEVLHVVDLAGSRDGGATSAPLIARLAGVRGLAVQVGGGIRTLAQARAYVEAGVQRIVLGSVAARDPQAALAIVRSVGPSRITLALDLKPSPEGPVLAINGWTEAAAESPWDVLQRYVDAGVTNVLCTDVSRDGELAGPNLALYADLLGRWPKLQLQASGGVATLSDLASLRRLGAAGAIVGKALYERRFSLLDALRVAAGRDDPEDDQIGGPDASQGQQGLPGPVGGPGASPGREGCRGTLMFSDRGVVRGARSTPDRGVRGRGAPGHCATGAPPAAGALPGEEPLGMAPPAPQEDQKPC